MSSQVAEGGKSPKRLSAIGALALVALGAFTLLLPAIANGYPFLFFDTRSYDEVGKSTVERMLKLVLPEAPAPAGNAGGGADVVQGDAEAVNFTGGRSPYYSLFIYLSEAAGPLWIVAAVQALIAAWILFLTARCATPERPARTYALLIGGLTLASSLPFYSAFTMPDVFTGIGILSTGILAVWLHRLSLWERLGLVAVAAYAATTHGTNPPLAALALVLLALFVVFMRPELGSLRQRSVWAAAPLLLAILAGVAYSTAAGLAPSGKPKDPPYLMARVLADGPAHTYLREACATSQPYELCRYKNQPLNHHNDILWSLDPKVGVVQLADNASRLKLVAEERDFVLDSIAADPVAQINASLRNSLGQFFAISVSEDFGHARRSWDEMNFAALMPSETAAATNALAYRDAFPFRVFDAFSRAGLVFSIGFLLWRLTRRDARAAYRMPAKDKVSRSLAAFAGVSVGLAVLLIANAVLCGTLSGVHDRYQARLIWLVPLVALLLFARFGIKPVAAEKSS